MIGFFFFLTGLVLGSFFNVCIYRIPKGISLAYPPSHCYSCGTPLKIIDLIPVLSYVFLRGKCRSCGREFSSRYAAVELLTSLIFLYFYQTFGLTPVIFPYLFLCSLLLVITFIDLDHMMIPNGLILLGLVGGCAFQLFMPFMKMNHSLMGFFAGALLPGLIVWASRGGMGIGDIKLSALIGFFLGARLFILTFFLAAFFAALTGLSLILTKRKSRKDPIPFGPFLSFAALIALLWGNEWIKWYLTYFF